MLMKTTPLDNRDVHRDSRDRFYMPVTVQSSNAAESLPLRACEYSPERTSGIAAPHME